MTAKIDIAPLREAAQAEIANGLAACQVAVAREEEVVSEGEADLTEGVHLLIEPLEK